MATDTTIDNLVINKLTKAQYQSIENPSDTEIYLVPDEDEMDSAPIEGSTNHVTSGGVYSAIKVVDTKLNSKQDTITGGATSIASVDLVASRALISSSSGKVAVSPVTSTELGYLSGVTSNIQTQLNSKSNFSGSYNDLTDKPTISTNLHIELSGSTDAGTGVITYTANYTYAEILAAINSGGHVDLQYGGFLYPYDGKEAAAIYFYRLMDDGASYTYVVSSSDVWTLERVVVIPSSLEQLTDDSTHRLVTDAEKSTWNEKQAQLVSGTNIKTINNEPILGSGNLSIEGAFIYTVDASGISQTGTKNIPGSAAYDAILAAYNAGKSVFVKWDDGIGSPYFLQPTILEEYQNVVLSFDFTLSVSAPAGFILFCDAIVSSNGCNLTYNMSYNVMGNNTIKKVISISEADYNALTTKDSNTLYVITQ